MVARQKNQFVLTLFREQQIPLLKYLTARFRDREDAAEIAQEAWLRIHRLEHPESLDNPKAFLFQTASNLAVDRLRRDLLAKKFLETEAQDKAEPSPSVERSVTAQEALAQIERALVELPVKCQHAFLLHRGRDMSYPEIARELGVSTSMVEKYMIQALKHFRKRLASE